MAVLSVDRNLATTVAHDFPCYSECMSAPSSPPSRLKRELGTFDAVIIGLGSMIGAGIFAAFGPAAAVAGNGLVLGLLVAALVAYCNATSSAELAAVYPHAGGAYVYGRERLGHLVGFVAGSAFVFGKLASLAAMALTFASYATSPRFAKPVAVTAVVGLTLVNYFGIKKTALVTRIIVALVLVSLGLVVAAVWLGGSTDLGRLFPLEGASFYGVLQASGFLFFAFAGYARIATLGEEVREPERTIPRAIPLALGVTLFVYAAVAVSAVAGVGALALASSELPLAVAVERGRLAWLSPVVRFGAAVASLGVLLSLIAGVSRTTFAMASNRDLPAFLSAVHPRYEVPHRAELAVGAIVAVLSATLDVRSAIGVSSFAVLVYYSVANAAAWTLEPEKRRWPRSFAALGFCGCLMLAVTLPVAAVGAGAAILLLAAVVHRVCAGSRQDARIHGEQ
jgi:APA family basic amino acid/polyamine antiporter